MLTLWSPRLVEWASPGALKVNFLVGQARWKLVEFKLLLLRVFAVELAESIKFEYFKTGLWKPWHNTSSDCLVFWGVCHSLLWEGWGCPFASLKIGNANGWFCQCRSHDGVVMPKIYRGHTVYYNMEGSPGQRYWLIVTCNLLGSWEVRHSSGAFSHPCSGSGKSELSWTEPPLQLSHAGSSGPSLWSTCFCYSNCVIRKCILLAYLIKDERLIHF